MIAMKTRWSLPSWFVPEPIKVGSTWRVRPRDKGDPFPPAHLPSLTTVLEVKARWVRYKVGDGSLFGDERATERVFRHIHEEVT